jgi:tRNA splicing endonuclease
MSILKIRGKMKINKLKENKMKIVLLDVNGRLLDLYDNIKNFSFEDFKEFLASIDHVDLKYQYKKKHVYIVICGERY